MSWILNTSKIGLDERLGIYSCLFLMHPIVIKELLYHVGGKRDGMHEKAIKALKAMFHHCGNTEHFLILADFLLKL